MGGGPSKTVASPTAVPQTGGQIDEEDEDNMGGIGPTSGGSKSDSVKDEGGVVGFFKYVFNFDDTNKYAILNMFQYTSLSIVPILLLLKGIKHFIPEDDDSKGSIEIAAESVGQLLFIMLALWFINKTIFYIPTYSGTSYKGFNEITFILPFVLILATLQTKLGAKFQILIDRVMNKWHGREGYADQDNSASQGQGQGGMVRVTQPMSPTPGHQPSQADLLPSDRQYSQMPPGLATKQTNKQTNPDFNSMYQQNNTPLVGAATPGMMMNEPMAANEIGGSWGSSF